MENLRKLAAEGLAASGGGKTKSGEELPEHLSKLETVDPQELGRWLGDRIRQQQELLAEQDALQRKLEELNELTLAVLAKIERKGKRVA